MTRVVERFKDLSCRPSPVCPHIDHFNPVSWLINPNFSRLLKILKIYKMILQNQSKDLDTLYWSSALTLVKFKGCYTYITNSASNQPYYCSHFGLNCPISNQTSIPFPYILLAAWFRYKWSGIPYTWPPNPCYLGFYPLCNMSYLPNMTSARQDFCLFLMPTLLGSCNYNQLLSNSSEYHQFSVITSTSNT